MYVSATTDRVSETAGNGTSSTAVESFVVCKYTNYEAHSTCTVAAAHSRAVSNILCIDSYNGSRVPDTFTKVFDRALDSKIFDDDDD
eukprot:IDg12366t1